ncbi:Oligopeptide transporter 2 [Candida viswanathii]|uniref:Oligopeptide transporter 2 n=1 Tax=Candida viswanathii TaxID=5486 RepID=A0A367XZT6_9ASCO|nr:Oligopeptide transporter 2 [Candida viswanathii]
MFLGALDMDTAYKRVLTITTSHLQAEDHEIDLHSELSSHLSIDNVAYTLNEMQKWYILKRLHFDNLLTLDDLPPLLSFIFNKVEKMKPRKAVHILKQAILEHNFDVNIPECDLNRWKRLVGYNDANEYVPLKQDAFDSSTSADDKQSMTPSQVMQIELLGDTEESEEDYDDEKIILEIVDWGLEVRLEAVLIAYWSPYPEVRAVTYPFDDPSIPVETIRVYLIGTIWTAIGALINQFFVERQPYITLAIPIIQVFLYPTGMLCELLFPRKKIKVWKYTIDLNPGPYNFKEQILATIFCSVSGNATSYVSSNILMLKSKMFYGNNWVGFGYQILLILCTNFLGIGLAGIMRKFAVYPVKAVWPNILPNLALNRTLLTPAKKEIINGWKISSYNFFFITFGISFVYFWFPDYLFQALSTFNWLTWIKPGNLDVAVITGSIGGLGLNPMSTFDWNYFSSVLQPLEIPFYNTANNLIGMLIAFVCITGIWYSNFKWTGYLPINDNGLFNNKGERYEVTSIVNSKSLFDSEKYQQVGPPFYSAANLVVYGAFFTLYPFHIIYEFGMNYKEMWDACKSLYTVFKDYRKSTYEGFDDPHSTMMKSYPEVPEWVYLIILTLSVVFAIICVKAYPAQTPVWSIFFAFGINLVFLIPITTIFARTGFSFGINVLIELIIGYTIPGNGLALGFIKAFGYNIDGQPQNFVNDLKQAHYAKLPPRAVFRIQLLSVFVASFIQLAILNFQVDGGIQDYCDPYNKQKFTCPGTRTYYSASVVWGVIGPKKVFGGMYPILQWCFLIGFLSAFPCIAIKKYGPRKYIKYFEPSIIIGGFLNYAPFNLSYYIPGFYMACVFMLYVKKRYEAWWQKYNYILSTGINAGIAFSSIIIFFAVMYEERKLDWWGNTVPFSGVDYGITGRLNATSDAPLGYFGPRKGEFP